MIEEKENTVEKYTSEIIRGPERSVKAMLLAEHLILSVTSTPLKSILHIAQAASMLPNDETEKLGIDPEEVNILLSVALTISDRPNMERDTMAKPQYQINFYSLDFNKYLRPWVRKGIYPFYPPFKTDILDYQRYEEAKKDPVEFFRFFCTRLSEMGYSSLISDFCKWGLPRAHRLAEKISTLVDQRTYTDVMRMIQKPIETTS